MHMPLTPLTPFAFFHSKHPIIASSRICRSAELSTLNFSPHGLVTGIEYCKAGKKVSNFILDT